MATLAIVDPYGPGDLVAAELLQRGHRVIKLETGPLPALGAATLVAESDYAEVIKGENLAHAATLLSARGVESVLPGSELGVAAAEYLRSRLAGATAVAPASPLADKDAMYGCVRAAGHHVLEWGTFDCVDLALTFARHVGYPVVLKPTSASGSDGVRVCRSQQELRRAFEALIATENVLFRCNEWLIVQAYAAGPQYEINLIRHGGDFIVTDIWRSRRHLDDGGSVDFAEADLVDPAEPDLTECAAYAIAVCEAIGLRNGPALVEVVASSAGPRLIEVNTRHDGHTNPLLLEACTGRNLFGLSVSAMVDEQLDLSGYERLTRPQLRAKILQRPHSSTGPGAKRLNGRWLATAAPSFFSARLLPARTGANADAPHKPAAALIYLAGRDIQALERDVQVILEAPEADLFIT